MASSSTPLLQLFLSSLIILSSWCCLSTTAQDPSNSTLTLDSVREYLTRQEDSIVFCLIERAKYPLNSPAYDPSYLRRSTNRSIAEIVVRDTEAIKAKAGQYRNQEEIPFFPYQVPRPLVPPYSYPQELYPAAASVNVSSTIWDMYFNDLLALFLTEGDDGNYAQTVESDFACLQVLSRRIHYGRYVAEVKFKDAPEDYTPAIHAQDQDALTNLLTSTTQEEDVVRRVEKKAMVFGQEVTLDTTSADTNNTQANYKVDPLVVARLYKDWVIPLTKVIEVDYLLRRLD